MKIVFIVGPHAVGKMTVGQELCALTGMKLFHNHMFKDSIYSIFSDDKNRWELLELVRNEVFTRFSQSDQIGLVFTFMPAYNKTSNLKYLSCIEKIFKENNSDVFYVELYANQICRLERNSSTNRLLHKISKRDIKLSEKEMIHLEKENRYVSIEGEYAGKQYIRIDNQELSPREVANMICTRWNLCGE